MVWACGLELLKFDNDTCKQISETVISVVGIVSVARPQIIGRVVGLKSYTKKLLLHTISPYFTVFNGAILSNFNHQDSTTTLANIARTLLLQAFKELRKRKPGIINPPTKKRSKIRIKRFSGWVLIVSRFLAFVICVIYAISVIFVGL